MSRRTTIRIPDDVYNRLAAQAEREQRTVSNLAIVLLREGLNNRANDSQDDHLGHEKAPGADASKAL
jgi:predicted DNA-binding protein